VRLRWAYFDGTKHTAVVIASPPNDQERDLPDLLWAYTWTTQHPTGDQAATSHGLARLFNTDVSRHEKATNKMQTKMRPKGETSPDWHSTYKKRLSAQVPNRWKDLWWLLARRSLFLGANAAQIGWDKIPHNCPSCDEPETIDHLFYHCPLAQICWAWCKRKWKASTRRSLTMTMEHALFGGDELWVSLSLATLYALWKARCTTVFGRSDPHPLPILQHLLQHHIRKLHHLNKTIRLWTHRSVFVTLQGSDLVFCLSWVIFRNGAS